jgi:glycosyltransferase involved in cell wall biosynthesis
VVAEAPACGVPGVVTPTGGPEELIRESGGGEVLGGFGADELAGRIEALLADEDRLVAMRRRGREHVVSEHDPVHLRDALRDVLEELGGG